MTALIDLSCYVPEEDDVKVGIVAYVNRTRLVLALHFWWRVWSFRIVWKQREW